MRILTDFDGVLTAQDAEAAAVAARLDERVAEAYFGDRMKSAALLAGLRAEVRASPAEHGWFVGDALGCYADEDPYVFNNAICRHIYERGPLDVLAHLKRAGFETADALAMACFEEGTRAWRDTDAAHVLDDALGAIQTFFAGGCEVVIVSNSSNERIRSILEKTAILRWGTGKIRIKGGARKFHVTGDRPKEVPESDTFGGRKILLRRGHYWDILQDEQPDVVIGDVLSLDVALPSMLRDRHPAFEETAVYLKRHPHTPAWALKACEERRIGVVDSFAELPGLLRV